MKKHIILLLIILTFLASASIAQLAKATENWYHLDPKQDKVNGISTNLAYEKLLKTKTAKTITVAVIDNGTETIHEDLKDIIWINDKEIPGNLIDDDKNGYIDDVNGWNFIGGANGKMVAEDNYEYVRLFRKL